MNLLAPSSGGWKVQVKMLIGLCWGGHALHPRWHLARSVLWTGGRLDAHMAEGGRAKKEKEAELTLLLIPPMRAELSCPYCLPNSNSHLVTLPQG